MSQLLYSRLDELQEQLRRKEIEIMRLEDKLKLILEPRTRHNYPKDSKRG